MVETCVVPDRLLNEQPRPRIIVDTYGEDVAEVLAVLDQWPGTVHTTQMHDVNWEEWDVLITDRQVAAAPAARPASRRVPDRVPVFVILQEFSGAGTTIDAPEETRGEYLRWAWSKGAHLSQPEGLRPEFSALIQSSLLPDLLNRDLRDGLGHWGVEHIDHRALGTISVQPLVKASNGVMVAGTYTCTPNGVTNWVVPADTDFVAWLRLAFAQWTQELPERFPAAPVWEYGADWATAAEVGPVNAIAAADALLEQAQRDHREAVTEARGLLEAARGAADSGLRRLLTDDGNSLVAATIDALTILGFNVTDMDELHSAGQRHEDLQVSDTDGWTAIVEVTGSQRGVPQQKWHKLMSHLSAYLRRPDSNRTAVPWLVVNQERNQDPNARSGLWQESFHEEVADDLGLGIEGPGLFVLARRIQEGDLTPETARQTLRNQRGVFTLADAYKAS
jgi:hypothetical protein